MSKKKHILVVCTGNTCRSPMAEGWLRFELHRLGLDKTVEVSSCGVFARKGVPASFESDVVMKNEAIDISRHKSKPLTRELIDSVTHIIVMSEEHRQAILDLYPETVDRIRVLGIEDPIGQDLQIYKDCFDAIKDRLKGEWNWITV